MLGASALAAAVGTKGYSERREREVRELVQELATQAEQSIRLSSRP
jgi:hypothetical protein